MSERNTIYISLSTVSNKALPQKLGAIRVEWWEKDDDDEYEWLVCE